MVFKLCVSRQIGILLSCTGDLVDGKSVEPDGEVVSVVVVAEEIDEEAVDLVDTNCQSLETFRFYCPIGS